ncbi:MAG: phage portal protein [Myxococcota bacterium]
MSIVDRRARRIDGSPYESTIDDPLRLPQHHEEWVDRYQYLLDAHNGENYRTEMVEALQLFRAIDEMGDVIARARRLHRDLVFVVEVAVSALDIPSLTLVDVEGADPEAQQLARQIWKRSQPAEFGDVWATLLTVTGDVFIEPVRMSATPPYQTRLCSHDPRTVYCEYDDQLGVTLERAVITHQVLGPATVDAYGTVSELGALMTYQRDLNDTRIEEATIGNRRARLDDGSEGPLERVDEEVPTLHGLGAVPLVHLRCIPIAEPEHSLPITHAMHRALAECDSLMSQISAVADRYANPKLVIKGAQVDQKTKLTLFGRIINLFGGKVEHADAFYLEARLDALKVISDRLEGLLKDVRATMPEFLFSGGTSNLSAEALELLATRFETKYRNLRKRIYGGLEKALAMAVAMERNGPYDPEAHPVTLQGPPLLPANVKARLEEIKTSKDMGLLLREDAVRHLQALDLIPDDVDPEEYVRRLDEEREALTPPQLQDADTDTDNTNAFEDEE